MTRGVPNVPRKIKSFEERFWPKVDRRGDDECWPWVGAKTSAGYGHLARGRRGSGTILAHRAAYLLLVGMIPTHLELDHLCHQNTGCNDDKSCPHRGCVNPAHLQPVTRRTNMLRGNGVASSNHAKTHCHNGHAYTPENTGYSRNSRYCRICDAEKQRRIRAWKKASSGDLRST